MECGLLYIIKKGPKDHWSSSTSTHQRGPCARLLNLIIYSLKGKKKKKKKKITKMGGCSGGGDAQSLQQGGRISPWTRDAWFSVFGRTQKRERTMRTYFSLCPFFLNTLLLSVLVVVVYVPFLTLFFSRANPKQQEPNKSYFHFQSHPIVHLFFFFFCGLSVRESPVLFSLMCVSVCIYIYKL